MYILIRLSSEISLKSDRVRARFQQMLGDNIRYMLKCQGIAHKLDCQWGRFFLQIDPANYSQAETVLKRSFGVLSFSPVLEHAENTFDGLIELGTKLFASKIAGKSFAVRCRRTAFSGFSSQDVAIALGSSLLTHSKDSRVDLKKPDVEVCIEIRDDGSYFYCDKIRGPGGLPLGTGGRALCLISGGFDSVAAAWLAMKRGLWVDFLVLDLGGAAFVRSVFKVAQTLVHNWGNPGAQRFYAIDFSPAVEQLRTRTDARYSQLLLKRLFLRAGDKLRHKIHSEALVTGEAIAQVSSQTLQNLSAIDQAVDCLVLRPLISYDKDDIVDLTRVIGTFDLCAPIQEFCQLVPKNPVTAGKLSRVLEEEDKLDFEALAQSFRQVQKLSFSAELDETMLVKEAITDPQVTLIDCRDEDIAEQNPLPGAGHIAFYRLMETFTKLDKSAQYYIYCDSGTQSLLAAEKMQARGYLAYSYRPKKSGFPELST